MQVSIWFNLFEVKYPWCSSYLQMQFYFQTVLFGECLVIEEDEYNKTIKLAGKVMAGKLFVYGIFLSKRYRSFYFILCQMKKQNNKKKTKGGHLIS